MYKRQIEKSAVAVFAETADDAELAEIERRHRDLVRGLDKAGLTEPNRMEFEALEEVLHNAIIGALHNALIETTYKRMHNYLRLVRLDRRITVPIARRSLREHLAIIEACQARDVEAAVTAVTTHFTAAMQRHMGIY